MKDKIKIEKRGDNWMIVGKPCQSCAREIAENYKELEDALVAIGWFHDDSPKWITETRFYQDASRRDQGSSIEIQIYTNEN